MFCEQHGKSREHVLPEWLREIFPRDENSRHMFGTIRPSTLLNVPRTNVSIKQGHTGSRKIKSVCEKCNNEWLSRLEESAKPVLEKLIHGDRVNLTIQTQITLATWAAKTAMTAEASNPRPDGISQEERSWLMNNLLPPETWVVWMAGYNGEKWRDLSLFQERGRLQFAPVRRPGSHSEYIQATTWGMGRVVFLVVGTALKAAPEIFKRFDGNGLFKIWMPFPRTILFPPYDILGDSDVDALKNVLSQSGAFDNSLNPLGDWNFQM